MSDIAFQNAPIGLVELENRVIRRANLCFVRIFRGAPADYEDRPLRDFYPSEAEFERIGARGLAAMRETGEYHDERIMRRADGDLFWCRVRGQSLTPENPFRHGIWSFADISDERPVVHLTPREREVAILTCRGLSAKEIGVDLALSYRTVEAHRARLLEKFGARKLPELVAKLSGMPL
ncbi:PAS and helix-turn-helix domain-containing protein [Antarcticimicrobium luteum]|uniref:PAS and helix-turn-helix domain-containing protein n=1 Tax=Antarcticimicrobium luteum TaxID=2547397 RepID=A0A4R5USS4_9RHOB|nr:PAS and helix-turn-helix domain-containing protein [Antarcticimicrobium luteum]TDK42162.1 PAS and helix-turn-helix domain-containing protein [Antarcticimicrobium luteum]